MLHIGILEDNEEDRKTLQGMLQAYLEKNDLTGKIHTFAESADLLQSWDESIGILFLDIQMSGKNGMETAKSLRSRNSPVQIIFVTNLPSFALESYSVHASGFLTKPVKAEALEQELKRALYEQSLRPERVWPIRHTEGTYMIPVSDILFIETWMHKLKVHLKKETLYCFGTIQKAEEELAGSAFFRCHSSYLVHTPYIEMLKEDSLVIGGETVPVSRHRRRELAKHMMEYFENNL